MLSGFFAVVALIAAVVVGLIAIPFMTQATLGVGCMAGACLIGILARLFQADAHHSKLEKKQDEVIEMLRKLAEASKPSN